jgi:hypothetical protein
VFYSCIGRAGLRRRYVHGDIGTDTFAQAREQLEVPARSEDDLISTGH